MQAEQEAAVAAAAMSVTIPQINYSCGVFFDPATRAVTCTGGVNPDIVRRHYVLGRSAQGCIQQKEDAIKDIIVDGARNLKIVIDGVRVGEGVTAAIRCEAIRKALSVEDLAVLSGYSQDMSSQFGRLLLSQLLLNFSALVFNDIFGEWSKYIGDRTTHSSLMCKQDGKWTQENICTINNWQFQNLSLSGTIRERFYYAPDRKVFVASVESDNLTLLNLLFSVPHPCEVMAMQVESISLYLQSVVKIKHPENVQEQDLLLQHFEQAIASTDLQLLSLWLLDVGASFLSVGRIPAVTERDGLTYSVTGQLFSMVQVIRQDLWEAFSGATMDATKQKILSGFAFLQDELLSINGTNAPYALVETPELITRLFYIHETIKAVINGGDSQMFVVFPLWMQAQVFASAKAHSYSQQYVAIQSVVQAICVAIFKLYSGENPAIESHVHKAVVRLLSELLVVIKKLPQLQSNIYVDIYSLMKLFNQQVDKLQPKGMSGFFTKIHGQYPTFVLVRCCADFATNLNNYVRTQRSSSTQPAAVASQHQIQVPVLALAPAIPKPERAQSEPLNPYVDPVIVTHR